ncbi:MAG: hypothetical protein NT082_04505 [Chloroflexi bacterium]|nr:hypothetical protein [Chloroflexota bacterium]
MVDNHKKSISWHFIFTLLFSVAIMALVFFASPTYAPSEVLGAYTSSGSATGLGTPILPKGTWFMYNTYDGGSGSYDIQLGNPKNGQDIIGSYQVMNNGDGTYTVTYNLDQGVKVDSAHLSVSNSPNFTAKPGQDANQSFGVPFSDANGQFYIFAHFSVEY